MATGYTEAIKDGITFEKYAMDCARAFGALVSMRDEPTDAPIPEEFKPSPWNADALAKAQAEWERVATMSDQACDAAAIVAYVDACTRHERIMTERRELRQKYEDMLAKARAYVAPTPEHVEYRAFMIEQIEKSIDWDCKTDYLTAPSQLSGKEWRVERLAEAQRDIAYHAKAHAEELERTAKRNAWVSALRESLKQP